MARVGVGKTNLAILSGELDLSTWSEEELLRAQRKSKRGTWEGRPPKLVPKAIHDELVRRKMSQAHDLLRDNLIAAVGVLVEIAKDGEAQDSDRIKAAQLIIERVMGKTPERVQLEVAPPWALAIQAMYETHGPLALERADDELIDAELVEYDED